MLSLAMFIASFNSWAQNSPPKTTHNARDFFPSWDITPVSCAKEVSLNDCKGVVVALSLEPTLKIMSKIPVMIVGSEDFTAAKAQAQKEAFKESQTMVRDGTSGLVGPAGLPGEGQVVIFFDNDKSPFSITKIVISVEAFYTTDCSASGNDDCSKAYSVGRLKFDQERASVVVAKLGAYEAGWLHGAMSEHAHFGSVILSEGR
jgi:hypothetical protein